MSTDKPDYSRVIDVMRFDTGVQQRQNLILNGSFETGDFSNWWPDGTVTIVITPILHGRYSCRMEPAASSISQLLPPWYADHTKFSFWMYNSILAANMLIVRLFFVDGTSEDHNISPTGVDAYDIYAVESDTHKQLCRITFLHNHATDILYLEGISGVLKDRPVTPTPGSEMEVTQPTAEDFNIQAILKPISCDAVHEQYTKGVGDSPVTILTTPAGKQAVVYYYMIWNNDDANDADVCLYIGATTCPLYSGHLDPDCGVIANLVRPVRGADGADVILTIAGSTDVDCIVHAEVVPFVDCMLEGDYSDWAVYDSFDGTIVDRLYGQYAVVNKEESEILLVEGQTYQIRRYTIATKTLGALDATQYLLSGTYHGLEAESIENHASVLGTYFVGLTQVAFAGDGVVVWKNGVLIKTFTYIQLGFDTKKVYSVSISRSGKYIIVSGIRTATGNGGWVVLKAV